MYQCNADEFCGKYHLKMTIAFEPLQIFPKNEASKHLITT